MILGIVGIFIFICWSTTISHIIGIRVLLFVPRLTGRREAQTSLLVLLWLRILLLSLHCCYCSALYSSNLILASHNEATNSKSAATILLESIGKIHKIRMNCIHRMVHIGTAHTRTIPICTVHTVNKYSIKIQ